MVLCVIPLLDSMWQVTKGLARIAAEAGAPVVSALEGGYNLK